MTYRYRQTLPATALDIIGDVHGEFAALQSLLHHLGYRDNGSHPQGRKLVFVGDLCDRGPDSPAVLAWFKQAHDAGHAFMVLGNHELNALVDEPKDGSGWYFPCRAEKDGRQYAPWKMLPEADKPALNAWLAEQPLVLANQDLRIVHAAWLPESLATLEAAVGEDLIAQYRRYDDELVHALQTASWYGDYLHEQEKHAEALENADMPPPPMPATAQYELARSRLHPIRALTTGAFGGRRAPTTQHSPLVGVDIQVREAQTLTIEAEAGWEYGALVITGSVAAADGTRAGADELLFIEQAEGSFTLAAEAGTHIMLLGGEPLPHPTVMWWNFVADSREAIAQAVADWNNHHPRFGQEIDLSGSTLKRLVAPEAPAGIR